MPAPLRICPEGPTDLASEAILIGKGVGTRPSDEFFYPSL
jgi:hypothetical protein